MNGHLLAEIVQGLGGEIVNNNTFSFPVSKVREVIPKLDQLGIGCTKVQEIASYNRQFGSRGAGNVVHLQAYDKNHSETTKLKGGTRTV